MKLKESLAYQMQSTRSIFPYPKYSFLILCPSSVEFILISDDNLMQCEFAKATDAEDVK